jgi:hypothetical protein
MLVHRSVIEDMIKRFPDLEAKHPSGKRFGDNHHALFMPFIHEGEYLSEDFAFCQRARSCGYKLWADLRVVLRHWGEAGFDVNDIALPKKGESK